MRILIWSFCVGAALAQCNEDEHHPANGGYFFIGAAGLSDEVNPDSSHGHRFPNSTWTTGMDYPYGQNVQCDADASPFCFPPCSEAPGCPQVRTSHTCSILHFCPPEGETVPQKVYRMPDFEATNACDFSNAEELGSTLMSEMEPCFEYAFEEDHELTDYYFSSQEGCAEGQRLAVQIFDYSMTADQCSQMGITTSRLRNCDCRLQQSPSTLSEPCRTAFSDSCQENLQEGDCCETSTCISIQEDYTHPKGKEVELARREQCDDDIPGMCYNEDGAGTRTNRMGSINCCAHTCSACGSELAPFASWKPCTSLDAESKIGQCGLLSAYDADAYECDFSLCESDDHWTVDGMAFAVATGNGDSFIKSDSETETHSDGESHSDGENMNSDGETKSDANMKNANRALFYFILPMLFL